MLIIHWYYFQIFGVGDFSLLWSIQGCSEGVLGVFKVVLGMFRGVLGVFWGVPNLFLVLQTLHSTGLNP